MPTPLIATATLALLPLASTPPRIGVLTVRVGGNLDTQLGVTAVDALATAVTDLGVGQVVTGQELQGLVSSDALPQAMACTDVACLIEIGGAADLDKMVVGDLARVDEALVVRLRVVSVRQARIENSVTLTWRGEIGAFLDLLEVGAARLLVPEDRRMAGRVVIRDAPAGFWWTANGRRMSSPEADLPTGLYDLVIEARGHAPRTQQIIVRRGQTTTVDAARAGATTTAESQPLAVDEKPEEAERSAFKMRIGLALQAEAVFPVTGYATDQTGWGGSISYWTQLAFIAMQPRVGFHYARGPGGATYMNLVADFGLFWVPFGGVISPMGGIGLGFRYLRNRWRSSTTRLGTIFATKLEGADVESHLGIAGYMRLGVMLNRDGRARPFLAGDYTLGWFKGNLAHGFVLAIGIAI